MTTIRSRLSVLAVTAALAALALTGSAQAAAPSCGISWGSTAESGATAPPAPGAAVAAVRTGRHDCYDRPANPNELAPVSGFSTFRQVASAGSFEGVTSVGLGVRARLPFRVTTLTGTPGSADGVRVVVDVAHHW